MQLSTTLINICSFLILKIIYNYIQYIIVSYIGFMREMC